jgi:hypothetical protein
MASYVFEQVKNMIVTGELNFKDVPDNAFTLALLDNTIVSDVATFSTKSVFGDISQYEIAKEGGYTKKGITSIDIVSIDDINSDSVDDIMIVSDDIVYPNSNITASCAVIFKADDDKLITALDLRSETVAGDPNTLSPIQSVNGSFRIKLSADSNGFLIIK